MKDLSSERLAGLALDAHEAARRFEALAPTDPGGRGWELVATVFRETLRALLMREVVRAGGEVAAEAAAELLDAPYPAHTWALRGAQAPGGSDDPEAAQ
jgi:hypothetical protein